MARDVAEHVVERRALHVEFRDRDVRPAEQAGDLVGGGLRLRGSDRDAGDAVDPLNDIYAPDAWVFRKDIDRTLRLGGGQRQRQRAIAGRARQQFGRRRVRECGSGMDELPRQAEQRS